MKNQAGQSKVQTHATNLTIASERRKARQAAYIIADKLKGMLEANDGLSFERDTDHKYR